MEVGIGLPSTVPGVTGDELTKWATRADERGFSTLGTIDRIAYPNLEPLVALAAAGAVTQRIGLTTSILIAPYRANAALLAKQAASVHRISNGRLTLGIAVGGREDDYEVSGVDFESRGERFDEMLEQITRIWAEADKSSGDPATHYVGPHHPSHPPRLVIGGYIGAAYLRAARFGDGYISGGAPPDAVAESRRKVDAAWREAGRDGTPYVGALSYFALGDRAEEDARDYLGDYYAWLGEETAGQIIRSAAKDADTVNAYIRAYEDAGADELILFPCSSDPEQVDLLGEAAFYARSGAR
jgi:alkanesulfonate monooxygenase SsuD/methylene tetrahydromethanopterin reductase-like flavin-dependent oxidoreductase (luciferase family)